MPIAGATNVTGWRVQTPMSGQVLLRSAAIGLAVLAGMLMGASEATAGTILSSRSDLDAILQGNGLTEDFEKFDMDGLPQI